MKRVRFAKHCGVKSSCLSVSKTDSSQDFLIDFFRGSFKIPLGIPSVNLSLISSGIPFGYFGVFLPKFLDGFLPSFPLEIPPKLFQEFFLEFFPTLLY